MPLLFIVVLFHALTSPSYGYVDPGSGHLIWQMLLSVGFGGLFFLKRFLSVFTQGRNRTKEPTKSASTT